MPDYLSDLREVVKRGEGSHLRRDAVLRKVRRLEIEFRRAGQDPNAMSQADFCRLLVGDPKEWMFRLCATRILRGDYSDWTGWEYRSQFAIDSYRPELPNKRWRLEKVGSLAVLGEQGVGDEILFASCIPDVMALGVDVRLDCDPRLVSIFSRSFGCRAEPRDDIVNRGNSQYLTGKREEDALIPLADLPRLFRKSLADFPGTPYLKPDPEKVEKWKHLRGRTGIAWRGRRGLFNPKELMEAAGLENPVVLQYDAWPYEAEGMEIPDCDLRNDLEDVLGICANLSKVVTVPQTIVHFTGPIGVPVEVVIPPVKSSRINDQIQYRYGLRPTMDWYRSVKVFQSMNEYRHR